MSTPPPNLSSAPGTGTPAPTLLVFTLGAEAQGRRKRLLPSRLRAPETALYRACLDEALEAGRAAGCRLEVSSPGPIELPADTVTAPQRGDGFGQRFAHAFDTAFGDARTAAHAPVVAVGTDTPGLGHHHVTRALSLLRQDAGDGSGAPRAVLGPSPDGGFYLLAANRPLGPILHRVRWCRRTTLSHLRRLLSAEGFRVSLLEPLADLDRRSDLERWLARLDAAAAPLTGRTAAAIVRLLALLRRPPAPRSCGRPGGACPAVRRGRAPPTPLLAA